MTTPPTGLPTPRDAADDQPPTLGTYNLVLAGIPGSGKNARLRGAGFTGRIPAPRRAGGEA